VFEISVSIETLFTEAGPMADRVKAAAEMGFDAVEIWTTSDKDLDPLESALDATGVRLWMLVAEPRIRLSDASLHGEYWSGLRRSCEVAQRLGCERVVTTSGVGVPFLPRADQHRTVVDALVGAGEIAEQHGVTVALENLNTRIDHPGILFDTTTECIQAIREVDSPAVRLLYDMYHSLAMNESPSWVLEGAADVVSHVHIADLPGRGEPGSGSIDWSSQLTTLRALGYDGRIGLEYFPTGPTEESLDHIRRLVDRPPEADNAETTYHDQH
jgi:hydroxypyruvate isomerase